MTRKKAILALMAMILMLVGCDGGSRELIGKWEGYDGEDNIEFESLDTVIWEDTAYDIEVADGKVIVDFLLFKENIQYAVDNNKLVLTRSEETPSTYIKEGSIKNNEQVLKELNGEWGFIRPLFTFTESGELAIKNLPETGMPSKGKFVAGNGVIRFEPESDQTQPIYLEYRFDEDKLILNYINEESMELVRVDTPEMRAKAKEEYQSRFDAGTLEQEEIADLEDAERKQYIGDKVVRYLFLEMQGPSEEGGMRGALDFDIDIRNMSSRTIKYISFKVFVRNAVGDLVVCEIGQSKSDKSVALNITGPIAPEEAGGVGGYWPSAIFNRMVTSWEIADVNIEYTNGDLLKIDGEDILLEEMIKPKEVTKPDMKLGDITDPDVNSENSFNGIELYFTKSYGELFALYGDICEIEKTDDTLYMNFIEPGVKFDLVFFSASPDQSDKPMMIMALPKDQTTAYNGLVIGMMPDEVINVLGEPLSNVSDGEKWNRLTYEFEKFDAEISCHETYGFSIFLLKNKGM